MGEVGSTEVLRMANILCTNDNVTIFTKTKADFVDSLFTHPDSIPYDLKMFWLGVSMAQNPTVAGRVLRRPQDPTALYAWAKEGLPLLVLSGSEDKQMLGQRLGEEMEKRFTNLTVHVFDGLGHALFYEDPENVYSTVFDFARKVLKVCRSCSLVHIRL